MERVKITVDMADKVRCRVKMLGGDISNAETMDYCIQKSLQQAKDFCNVHEFPESAKIYVVEWIVSDYLTETDGYSRQWERIRRDAEAGLLRYRRMRW